MVLWYGQDLGSGWKGRCYAGVLGWDRIVSIKVRHVIGKTCTISKPAVQSLESPEIPHTQRSKEWGLINSKTCSSGGETDKDCNLA